MHIHWRPNLHLQVGCTERRFRCIFSQSFKAKELDLSELFMILKGCIWEGDHHRHFRLASPSPIATLPFPDSRLCCCCEEFCISPTAKSLECNVPWVLSQNKAIVSPYGHRKHCPHHANFTPRRRLIYTCYSVAYADSLEPCSKPPISLTSPTDPTLVNP